MKNTSRKIFGGFPFARPKPKTQKRKMNEEPRGNAELGGGVSLNSLLHRSRRRHCHSCFLVCLMLPFAAAAMAEPVVLTDKTFDNVREVRAKTHAASSVTLFLFHPRQKHNEKCDTASV